MNKMNELVTAEQLPGPAEVLRILSNDLSIIIDKVFDKIPKDIVSNNETIKELTWVCQDEQITHPDWCLLAGRVQTLYLKRTIISLEQLYSETKKMWDKNYYQFVTENMEQLKELMVDDRDWTHNIFSVKTLMRSYFAVRRLDDDSTEIVETPQRMYLRIATFLWFDLNDVNGSLVKIKQTYDDLSTGMISHASPTMMNAGMKRPQMSSCFVMSIEDNMDSISKGWKDGAIISMNNGGVGKCMSALRHSGIGNRGISKGLIPWLRIDERIFDTVDQGGSQRKGSCAEYIQDWHIDMLQFLDLKKPIGKEEFRARELFYGVMVSDLFMNRVRNDDMWTLFCPAKTNNLVKKWGSSFHTSYEELERKSSSGEMSPRTFQKIKARELWLAILDAQIETGTPYLIFKDAMNAKSPQRNLGTIRLSNLCTEIALYTDPDNISSCNLATIPLSSYVISEEKPRFDFVSFSYAVRRVIRNLEQVITRNYYPDDIPQIKHANDKNRPLGIGWQDLAGCLAKLDLCWESERTSKLVNEIAKCMYYHGMDENIKMAMEYGKYETFDGSPYMYGFFQPDMWNAEKQYKDLGYYFDDEFMTKYTGFIKNEDGYDWELLRHRMVQHGLRFSVLFAQPPTASTAHILGNNESIEPYSQLLGCRTVLGGQYVVHIPHLVKDLEAINMWNDDILRYLIKNNGSMQDYPIDDLDGPTRFRMNYLKRKYRTIFEISQKKLNDLYMNLAKYQCQSMSKNLFYKSPTHEKLSNHHYDMWEKGAKTGMYYLRQTSRSDPLNFSIDHVSTPIRKRSNAVEHTECISCSA